MTAIVTMLGCGNSAGVPQIGNEWGKCDPSNPKNMRTRPSLAVTTDNTTLIIDTGPDFRAQMNRENLTNLNAVLYTHAHGDHVHGIDDLRVWHDRQKRRIPVYGNAATIKELQQRFHYIFETNTPLYPSVVEPHIWTDHDFGIRQTIGDIDFTVFEQDHGYLKTLGFRFGDVGYSTDMANLEQPAIDTLRGIKTWIADGANFHMQTVFVRANMDRLMELNTQIGAEKIILTHMPNYLDYATMMRELPDLFRPGYDGLKIAMTGEILGSF